MIETLVAILMCINICLKIHKYVALRNKSIGQVRSSYEYIRVFMILDTYLVCLGRVQENQELGLFDRNISFIGKPRMYEHLFKRLKSKMCEHSVFRNKPICDCCYHVSKTILKLVIQLTKIKRENRIFVLILSIHLLR